MKRIFTFLITLLLSVYGFSQQQVLYQADQKKTFLVAYQYSSDYNQTVVNDILDILARSRNKPVSMTKFTITCDENIKVTRSGNKVNIMAEYQNMKLSGDVNYKDFDISDVLAPSQIQVAASLSRSKNTPALATWSLKAENFNYPFHQINFQFTDTTNNNSYYFEITSLQFSYTHDAKNELKNRIEIIEDYYHADQELFRIKNSLDEVDEKNIDNIEQTRKTLNMLGNNIEKIRDAAFWKVLNIDYFDPLDLKRKMMNCKNMYHDIDRDVDYTYSRIHILYYEKGYNYFNAKNYSAAKKYMDLSLQYNNDFAPARLYSAKIAYATNAMDDCKEQLRRFYKIRPIDNLLKDDAHQLAFNVQWVDLNKAADLLMKQKYSEALASANDAEKFCKSIPDFTCSDTIELIRKDCHTGIFNTYITNAKQSYTEKKFDKAETEINNAIDYQKNNARYVTWSDEAFDLLDKIKAEQYTAAINLGKQEMKLFNYRNAFDDFKKASAIELKYDVIKDKQLPELIKKCKLELLYISGKEAEQAVADNNLTKARDVLKTVISEQAEYQLTGDKKLNQQIESLKKSIFSQECANEQTRYDNKIAEANNSAQRQEFIAAESQYNEAQVIANKNYDCGINPQAAQAGLDAMRIPAEYQRRLNQSKNYVLSHQYSQAISKYNETTDYFNKNKEVLTGIDHKELVSFMLAYPYDFLQYGITWYVNNNQPDNALLLMKNLRTRNVLAKLVKNEQIQLANAVAQRDIQTGSTLNPKQKVLEYTMGDKWYSVFSKTYVKAVATYAKSHK